MEPNSKPTARLHPEKADTEAIAAEIEELMLGQVSNVTLTPTPPSELTREVLDGNRLRLMWNAAVVDDHANWVDAYRVYRDDKPAGIAYGTKYFDTIEAGKAAFVSRGCCRCEQGRGWID